MEGSEFQTSLSYLVKQTGLGGGIDTLPCISSSSTQTKAFRIPTPAQLYTYLYMAYTFAIIIFIAFVCLCVWLCVCLSSLCVQVREQLSGVLFLYSMGLGLNSGGQAELRVRPLQVPLPDEPCRHPPAQGWGPLAFLVERERHVTGPTLHP